MSEWEDGLLECVAEGPVEYRRMGKSTPTSQALGAHPCSQVPSVDLGLRFLKWHLWGNNDNTYLGEHLLRP